MGKKREQFGKIGLILTAAGSAVGLGNIWKFPTLAGQNGGGVFLLFYVFFIVVLGIPLLVGETTIGRYAQTDPTNAYKKIAKECGQSGWKLKFWTFVGFTGVVANFLILCYYSVIAGWILQYCIKVLFVPIGTMDMNMFQTSISSYVIPIICALAFIWITYAIDIRGVTKGLEKCAKYLMPTLFIMLVVCAVCNCTLDGAIDGVKFLFQPNFNNIYGLKGYGKIAFAALGQCFFSLSLGSGEMIAFGSFANKDDNLLKQNYAIPVIDTMVALISGMVTLPAVFAMSSVTGIDPTSQTGPGMLMYALPQSLNQAFGSVFGSVVAFVMFLLVVFAALTSTTGLMTVATCYINEYHHVERKKAMTGIAIAVSIGAVICSLSNTNVLGGIQIAGYNIQDMADWFVSNMILPFGSFFMCIFIGYIWKVRNAEKEITSCGKHKFIWAKFFEISMLVIDPLIILLVFLCGIGIINI